MSHTLVQMVYLFLWNATVLCGSKKTKTLLQWQRAKGNNKRLEKVKYRSNCIFYSLITCHV